MASRAQYRTALAGLTPNLSAAWRRDMPLATRERIAEDVRAVLAADPTIAKRLEATGQVVTGQSPAQFAGGIKELRDKLGSIAKLLDMKATK